MRRNLYADRIGIIQFHARKFIQNLRFKRALAMKKRASKAFTTKVSIWTLSLLPTAK